MTENAPEPVADEGGPDDVGADPTTPDIGDPQPYPGDVDTQDPDAAGDDGDAAAGGGQ